MPERRRTTGTGTGRHSTPSTRRGKKPPSVVGIAPLSPLDGITPRGYDPLHGYPYGVYGEGVPELEGVTMGTNIAKYVAITTLYLVLQLAALQWVADGVFTLP